MALVRLDTLRDDAYKAADQEDHTLCPTAEVTRYVNQSIKKLLDFLAVNHLDYFKQSAIFTTASGTDTYTLPSDFHRLVNVFWDAGIGRLLRMEECPSNEDEYTIAGTGWCYLWPVRYELLVGRIRFIPTPTGTFSVTVKYIPTFTDLVNNADTVEMYNGWEVWVTNDAAIEMCEKEESDQQAAKCMRRRDEAGARILAIAKRNPGEPKRIQDVVGGRTTRYGGW